jgi:nicotinamide-nucleotide amidase
MIGISSGDLVRKINAEIISIGNELLSGLTTNTNASYIGEELSEIGINVSRIVTISDIPIDIKKSLKAIDESTQIIIVTGGLGPTPDDLTKNTIAEFFNTKLVLHEETLLWIRKLFEGRGMKMPDINRDQAMVPANAKVIPNNFGTAPALEIEQNEKTYYFLPGVPYEMKNLISTAIIKGIRAKYAPIGEDVHIFRTNGLAESKLFEKIREALDSAGNKYNIAFLPKTSGVDLRIKSKTGQKLDQGFLEKIRNNIADNIYSETEDSLPEIIGNLLIKKNYTLAVAESFTGGALSDWISNVPGCSQYFIGSVITYSNISKIELLNVQNEIIENFGAVSHETVEQMVLGVQKRFKTDCAIASTGIAGPGGATQGKPVGLCYLAASVHKRIKIQKYNFGKDRRINKERGTAAGLELLRRLLLE